MQRFAQAAPERTGLRRFAPPRGLAALMGIVTIVGLCWALTVPAFQSPDEIPHFAYAESLARGHGLPGGKGRPAESSEQDEARAASGADATAFHPQTAPPPWSAAAVAAYVARERSANRPSASDGGGNSSASQNPPLYYLYADVAYLIDDGGSTFGRLYGMRLSGVILMLITTVGAWLLAGETFGRRRLAQLATAATAALLPMSSFMSTNVNPDAGLIPTWTVALWLGARVINRRARTADAVALCAVTAAAILVKATSYALVIPVLAALAVGWWRRADRRGRAAVGSIGAALAVLLGPIIGWLALNAALHRTAINQVHGATHPVRVGEFFAYVWQYYLPKLWFMSPIRTTPGLPLRDVWIDQGTGSFGWLDVSMPTWVYTLSMVALGLLTIAVIAFVSRLRGRRVLALLGFYALTLLALLVLLHVTEYRVIISGGGSFLQGRYLLPCVALLGLAVGLVVSRVPRQARAAACGLALCGLLAAQVMSLTSIVHGYYL